MQTLPVDDPQESEIHTLLSPCFAVVEALYRATDIAQHQAEGAENLPPPRGRPKLAAGTAGSPAPRRAGLLRGRDFNQVDEEYLRYFVELGGLRSHERVLDVGCGIDRPAVPLTRYLGDRGSYEGLDVFLKGIA